MPVACYRAAAQASLMEIRRPALFCLALGAACLAAATPALAQGGVQVPEPSDLTLLGIGIAGLVIGRYAARRRPED